jgi:pimeloyl-ACP methyl ester carboxylesterase
MDDLTLQLIARGDGIELAVRFRPGCGPTIIFLPGYMSDMQGSKALALDAWARESGHALLRFDYSGCGESAGHFEDGTIDQWRDDVLCVIERLVTGPVILIGSSMGGWLALLVAQILRRQVVALIGIAAAPDFTQWGFSHEEKRWLEKHDRIERPSQYSPEPMVTTAKFWQSGARNLLLDTDIAIDCPIRLIHGQRDPDVPWEISLQIAAHVRSADVQTILIKDGDHRLSRDSDIALMRKVVRDVLETT